MKQSRSVNPVVLGILLTAAIAVSGAAQQCKPVVGRMLDLPPGHGGFASLITFTGGTGEMANATGKIRLRGEFDAVSGTASGNYIGTVCKAR